MKKIVLADHARLQVIFRRMAWQLVERHRPFSTTILIGIQPRGVYLLKRLLVILSEEIVTDLPILHGELDITFYRDDFSRKDKLHTPSHTRLPVTLEERKVVLVDDVLYTGRTIRAALDALLDYGRPQRVELMCLVDRKFSRHFPIEPTYTGLRVDTRHHQRVRVQWREQDGTDQVILTEEA